MQVNSFLLKIRSYVYVAMLQYVCMYFNGYIYCISKRVITHALWYNQVATYVCICISVTMYL